MSTYSASINLVRFSMCISGVTQLVCGLVEQGQFGCPIDYYNYYFIFVKLLVLITWTSLKLYIQRQYLTVTHYILFCNAHCKSHKCQCISRA